MDETRDERKRLKPVASLREPYQRDRLGQLPEGVKRVTPHGRPDAARGVQPGLRASTAFRPVAVGVGGAERGAPMSQSAYRRVCGAATPKGAAQRGCLVTGPRSRRQQDPRYRSSGSLAREKGFTREPLSHAAQWRCGPVARPEWPTVPITSPRFTRAPSLTVAESR